MRLKKAKFDHRKIQIFCSTEKINQEIAIKMVLLFNSCNEFDTKILPKHYNPPSVLVIFIVQLKQWKLPIMEHISTC